MALLHHLPGWTMINHKSISGYPVKWQQYTLMTFQYMYMFSLSEKIIYFTSSSPPLFFHILSPSFFSPRSFPKPLYLSVIWPFLSPTSFLPLLYIITVQVSFITCYYMRTKKKNIRHARNCITSIVFMGSFVNASIHTFTRNLACTIIHYYIILKCAK